MISRLTPVLISLIYDAVLKSYWRKKPLREFLSECGIQREFLSTWSADETKRLFLDRLFEDLRNTNDGRRKMLEMGQHLSEQDVFPDLHGWEESESMVRNAKNAVAALRKYLQKQDVQIKSRSEREVAQKRYREHQLEVSRSRADLEKLRLQLDDLATRIGLAESGYNFQDWFYDLMDYGEITNRRPYTHNGRQIDGSITLSDTTYLVELKFTADQASATDIDTFIIKVNGKADNTMGIMVSVSGYSSVAKNEASGPKTPLLLLDHNHLYAVLVGAETFEDIVDRVRRHASQTGQAYLAIGEFGG